MPRQTGDPGSPTFETIWPDVARCLRAQLSRVGAPEWLIEDVVQETALRLLRKWDDLDKSRSLLPWAATVARHVLTDHQRAVAKFSGEEAPDRPVEHVEDAALARVELARVYNALDKMNPRYRDVLLAEVGDPEASVPVSRIARNSARMRARRQLVAILQTMRGVVITTGISLRRAWRDLYVRANRIRNGYGLEGLVQGATGILVMAALLAGTPVPSAHGATTPVGDAIATASRGEQSSASRSASSKEGEEIGARSVSGKQADGAGDPASKPGLTTRIPRSEGGAENGVIFGPEGYDVAQRGSASAEGQTITWKQRHRYETPECVQRLAAGEPPGECEPGEGPSGGAEVTAAGHSARAEYGD